MEDGRRGFRFLPKAIGIGLHTKKTTMKFKPAVPVGRLENLIIWQIAMEYGEEVNKLSNKFSSPISFRSIYLAT